MQSPVHKHIMIQVLIISTLILVLLTANHPLNSTMAKSNKAEPAEVKSSDAGPSSSNVGSNVLKKNIPSIKLSYEGHTYPMLPFVVVQGQDVNKLNFPQLPDDFQPVVKIPQEGAFTLNFDTKPRETNAFVIDYDADVTVISPVNKLGKDKFSVTGVTGPRTLEIRAIYSDDMYVTYTLLVQIDKGGAVSTVGSPEQFQSPNELAATGFINENKEGEMKTKNIDTSDRSDLGTASSVEDRILREYGGMVKVDNPIGPNPTNFASESSPSDIGCMAEEIPITSQRSNDNSTSIPVSANSTNEQNAPWVQIDLGSLKQVCGVKVQFKEGANEVKFFTIRVSEDGASFTQPKYYSNTGSGSSAEIYKYNEEPVSARYIKLTELGKVGTDDGWVSELKVLGLRE